MDKKESIFDKRYFFSKYPGEYTTWEIVKLAKRAQAADIREGAALARQARRVSRRAWELACRQMGITIPPARKGDAPRYI